MQLNLTSKGFTFTKQKTKSKKLPSRLIVY